VGRAASPFIVDDAIVGLAQPLTEALNQLASGPRRACDLIEELGRREEFYLVPEGNLLVFRGRKTTIVQYATVTSSSLNACGFAAAASSSRGTAAAPPASKKPTPIVLKN
jgi:hypothetical protein